MSALNCLTYRGDANWEAIDCFVGEFEGWLAEVTDDCRGTRPPGTSLSDRESSRTRCCGGELRDRGENASMLGFMFGLDHKRRKAEGVLFRLGKEKVEWQNLQSVEHFNEIPYWNVSLSPENIGR